jgi:hypothetical protein
LANAEVQRNLCRVPAVREHFLSLAYHAVYHKGYGSGLADGTDSKPAGKVAEHNYHAVLTDLAKRLFVDVPITLADLDHYLNDQGWRPPRETLQRLAEQPNEQEPVSQDTDVPWTASLARAQVA